MRLPLIALLLNGLALSAMSLASPASAQTLALISSEKDNAITVISLPDMKLQAPISTCKRPRHMQLSPDRKQLLVACSDSQAADVIDMATLRSVRRVPLSDDPEIFDLSPDGKTLYASNEDDAALTVVDLVAGKIAGSVPVGKEPEGVKVSPDGKTVYVTSEVANSIHVIDTATRKLVKTVGVGQRPRRFALTPDGKELWVTNELGASVSIISTANWQVLKTLTLDLKGARASDITPVGIQISRSGKQAYVAMGRANHVAFIDVASRQITDRVLVGKRAWGLALNQDESRLFVVNGLSDDLTVVDVKAAKALQTLPVGRVPHTVVLY